jgi:cell division protein ZapA
MKQVEVQIMGQSYLLGCPDGGDERLLQAVEQVDAAMCKIRDSGKVRARDRIAVLAAINLTFDLNEQKETAVQAPTAPDAMAATAGDAAGADKLRALLAQLDDALLREDRLL